MMEYLYWGLELAFFWYAIKGKRQALMVLALSLPLSRRLPALPFPLLNYENILLVITVLVFFKDLHREKNPAGHVRHWIPLGILGVLTTAAFLNTLLTFEPEILQRMWGSGYHNLIRYKSMMMCLALYVLASVGLRSAEELRGVVRWGVIGVILEAGYTAAEYLIRNPGRATGHMVEPNYMGAYLSGSLGLLLALVLLLPRGHRDKPYLLGGLAAGIVALLGTLSRGAYLAAGIGFAALTAMVNRRVLVLGVILVGLNALWIPAKVRGRLDDVFIAEERMGARFEEGRAEEGSAIVAAINRMREEKVAQGEIAEEDLRLSLTVQARLVIWEAALRIMWDYPMGIGMSTFPWYLPYYSNIVMFKSTHNIYLRVGTEIGIPALLVFLYLVVILLWDALKIGMRAQDPELRALGFGMFTYGLALAANAFVVDVFFVVSINGQFWLFMGALMQAPALLARSASGEASEPERPRDEEKPLYELVR